jgi:acyl dehydratase
VIEPGTKLPEWSASQIELARIHVLALILGDPNVIHVDADAVRRMGLGDAPVNQGPANMAYLVNMLTAAFPAGRLRSLDTRLHGTVFAGDAVRAGGVVTAAEPARRNSVLVRCSVWLERVTTQARVLDGTAEIEVPAAETGVPAPGSLPPA